MGENSPGEERNNDEPRQGNGKGL